MPVMDLPQFYLTLKALRSLMTAEHGEFVPRKVGSALCHQMPAWQPGEGDDVRDILLPLVDELRTRLDEEGIERSSARGSNPTSVPSRSRDDARALAGLLPFVALLVQGEENQLALVDEGIDWSLVAGDPGQETVLRTLRAAMQFPSRSQAEIFEDHRTGIETAVRAGEYAFEMDLRYGLIDLLLTFDRLDEARDELRVIKRIAAEQEDPEERQFLAYALLAYGGEIQLKQDDPLEAILLFQEALAELPPARDVGYERIATLENLASAYGSIGENRQAISTLLDLVDYSLKNDKIVPAVRAHARIGELYLELDELDRAHEAFELAERSLPTFSLSKIYDDIAARKLPLLLQRGEYEEGITIATGLLDSEMLGTGERSRILKHLGLFLERTGDLCGAEKRLKEGYDIVQGNLKGELDLGLPLARVLVARGEENRARELLLGITDRDDPALTRQGPYADCLDLLADVNEKKGDLASAIDFMKRSAETRRAVEKTERESFAKKTQLAAELRRRETSALIDQRTRVSKELELAEILTGLQKTRSSFDRIREEIATGLDWLAPEDLRKVVDVLRRAISDPQIEEAVSSVSTEADALEGLRDVDQEFFDRLDERWPGLTKSQKQFCGMLRAGLDTQEIAALLKITHNAVWTKRKRLRKRLELGEEESLEGVIAGVGNR